MAATHKAALLAARTDPLSLTVEDIPIPLPIPGSVVIRVLAIPLIDYHRQIFTGSLPYTLHVPLIPGGSCVGRVAEIGPDTTSLSVGQLVIVDPTVRGRDDQSVQFLLGMHSGFSEAALKFSGDLWRNGTFAQYAKLPLENVFPLDEKRLCGDLGYSISELSLIQTCMIPYGGLDAAGVKSGDIVIVAPATGTFGGAAVITALAMGATVLAVGRSQETLDAMAKSMGSPRELKTVRMVGDVDKDTAAIVDLTGPRGADVYLDLSPATAAKDGTTPTHIHAAIGALRRGGTCALMGGVSGMISIPYPLLVFKNLTLRGKFMYERDQVIQCIKLAEGGKLKLGKAAGKEIVGPYGIDSIVEALEVAENLHGFAKTVVVTP